MILSTARLRTSYLLYHSQDLILSAAPLWTLPTSPLLGLELTHCTTWDLILSTAPLGASYPMHHSGLDLTHCTTLISTSLFTYELVFCHTRSLPIIGVDTCHVHKYGFVLYDDLHLNSLLNCVDYQKTPINQ
jgi:hypothetical protein